MAALCCSAMHANASNKSRPQHKDIVEIKEQKPEQLEGYYPVALHPNSIKSAVYANPKNSADERTKDLISRLTFDEKLALTTAVKPFNYAGVPRLGIRPVTLADASQGLRMGTVSVSGKSTSMPGMLPLAATWDVELAEQFGKTMAEECRALGVDILLGPSMNMQRQSVGGRNYEYMGEDPLLTGDMAKGYILGLQSLKIVPTAKHFIANDQEFVRHIANSVVDDRTMREIYLRPWEKIIKEADAMGIMSGNNVVNGVSCAMHKPLIADVLRKEFGFKGIAMTDWQNTRYFPNNQDLVLPSTTTIIMPDNYTFTDWLWAELKQNPSKKAEIEKQLETMIYPNLYTFFKMGVYDREPQDISMKATFNEHQMFARKVAQEAIVLLKNEDKILPINKSKRVVLIGEEEIFTGTGSGHVKGYEHVSYAMGLKAAFGDNFSYSKEIDEKLIKQADVVLFNFNKLSGEGHDIPFEAPIEPPKVLNKLTQLHDNVVVLLTSSNTMPTPWLKDVKGVLWLSFLGQERGHALANIISGKTSPSGKLPFTFEKDFNDSPDPEFNFLGDQAYWYGNNKYKPYWLGWDDKFNPAFTNYVKPHQLVDIPYSEGVFMGYRWFEAKQLPIVFPFGHGLSYTDFSYKNIKVNNNWKTNKTVTVSMKLSNTGEMAANEIVQLYIADHKASVLRPVKELKAFKKVYLKAGQSKTVTFTLDADAFNYWSVDEKDWVVESGDFDILIGSSSQNIHLKKTLVL